MLPHTLADRPLRGWCGRHGDEYWIGKLDMTTYKLQPEQHGMLDYGGYYTGKSASGENQVRILEN